MNSTAQVQLLSPSFFLNMLKAGAQRVISKENMLNQINVFPVNDRDTGSNMAALMRFFLSQSYSTTDIAGMLSQVADAALIGASGNSGMILSAFFLGFSSKQNFYEKNALTINEFIECLQHGVKQAYQAVSKPVEGTMLTIMSAWSKACDQLRQQSKDFIDIFQKSIPIVENALKETKNQLSVLSRNNTVDAGAAGFMELIYGMHDYLLKPQPIEHIVDEESDSFSVLFDHSENDDHEPNFQFCAETLLACDKPNIEEIRKTLEGFGDSLVINQSPHYVKIHLHTDDALLMTKQLKKYGSIQHQKIDSMQKQWGIAHTRKHPIALVTDSAADLPKGWADQEQVHVLPLQIRMGKDTFLDKMTLSLDDLYEGLHKDKLSAQSAMTSPEIANRYLQFLSSHYESIIVIPMSSYLSGTFQMFSQVAKKIKRVPIDVIDSRRSSTAQGLLVMSAARMIAKGYTHSQIIEKLKQSIDATDLIVAIDEFNTLAKSGRAPRSVCVIGNLTGIKPVLVMDKRGKPKIGKIAIGSKMCWHQIAKIINKAHSLNPIKSLAVAYSCAADKAQEFANFIESKTGLKIRYITPTSCAIGLHVGKNGLAVAISQNEI